MLGAGRRQCVYRYTQPLSSDTRIRSSNGLFKSSKLNPIEAIHPLSSFTL